MDPQKDIETASTKDRLPSLHTKEPEVLAETVLGLVEDQIRVKFEDLKPQEILPDPLPPSSADQRRFGNAYGDSPSTTETYRLQAAHNQDAYQNLTNERREENARRKEIPAAISESGWNLYVRRNQERMSNGRYTTKTQEVEIKDPDGKTRLFVETPYHMIPPKEINGNATITAVGDKNGIEIKREYGAKTISRIDQDSKRQVQNPGGFLNVGPLKGTLAQAIDALPQFIPIQSTTAEE